MNPTVITITYILMFPKNIGNLLSHMEAFKSYAVSVKEQYSTTHDKNTFRLHMVHAFHIQRFRFIGQITLINTSPCRQNLYQKGYIPRQSENLWHYMTIMLLHDLSLPEYDPLFFLLFLVNLQAFLL